MKNFLKILPLLLILTSCGIWTAKNSRTTSAIHQSVKQCALVGKECAKNCMLYGNSESDCDEYCCRSALKKTSAPTKQSIEGCKQCKRECIAQGSSIDECTNKCCTTNLKKITTLAGKSNIHQNIKSKSEGILKEENSCCSCIKNCMSQESSVEKCFQICRKGNAKQDNHAHHCSCMSHCIAEGFTADECNDYCCG